MITRKASKTAVGRYTVIERAEVEWDVERAKGTSGLEKALSRDAPTDGIVYNITYSRRYTRACFIRRVPLCWGVKQSFIRSMNVWHRFITLPYKLTTWYFTQYTAFVAECDEVERCQWLSISLLSLNSSLFPWNPDISLLFRATRFVYFNPG